jgi:hypothetical protein
MPRSLELSADGPAPVALRPDAPAPSGPTPSGPTPSGPAAGISTCDVVVRDLALDRQRAAAALPRLPAELASPSRLTTCVGFVAGGTCQGNSDSDRPVLDADGSALAYESLASDLVPDDTNVTRDVFQRRFMPVLNGAPVDFGAVQLDSQLTLGVPVVHSGFGPLADVSATVSGVNAGDFTVVAPDSCAGAVLHETDGCTVSVQFRPSGIGPRTATLEMRWRAGTTPLLVPLAGTGTRVPVPGFVFTPDPLDFGLNPVTKDSNPLVLVVTNNGDAPLHVNAVTVVGSGPTEFPNDYRITANTCTGAPVASGASCRVTVVQRALGVGVRPAELRFEDDVPPAAPRLIPVTGGGLQPTLLASPPVTQPGQVSRITGIAFPPGRPVSLTLDRMPGTTTAVADAAGGFVVPLVVFPHTDPGPRLLRASSTAAVGLPGAVTVSVAVTATTNYIVVPGTLQPPDFAVRS